MLNHSYSFADCLENAIKSSCSVEDCFQGRRLDFSKRFLPDRIAGVNGISCLGEDEKLKLNQIRGNSYCHIFAFVEEYIIAMVLSRPQAQWAASCLLLLHDAGREVKRAKGPFN